MPIYIWINTEELMEVLHQSSSSQKRDKDNSLKKWNQKKTSLAKYFAATQIAMKNKNSRKSRIRVKTNF